MYPNNMDSDRSKFLEFGFPELMVDDINNPDLTIRKATIKCWYSDSEFKAIITNGSDIEHGCIFDDGMNFADDNNEPYSILNEGLYKIEVVLEHNNELLAKTYKDFELPVFVNIEKVLIARDSSDTKLGYVLNVTTSQGYGGDIKFSIGITNDGTVNGISILSISETAGLGMRAEDVLKPQYAGKNVPEFTVVKTGAANDSEIDAISGATITSKAVTGAVNGSLYFYQTSLEGGNYEE